MDKKDFTPKVGVTRVNKKIYALYCRLMKDFVFEKTIVFELDDGVRIKIDVTKDEIIGIEILGLDTAGLS